MVTLTCKYLSIRSLWTIPFLKKGPAKIIYVGVLLETQLISGLKLRDQKSYSLLYKRYAPALLGIIRRRIKCPVQAEDILQEVFIKISKNIDTYDPSKGKLFTWLARITNNTTLDQVRSRYSRDSCQTDDIDDKICSISVYHHYSLPTDSIGIKDLINTLDPLQRSIIDLVYYKGYTQIEAAEMLQIPLGTLKTRWRYSMISLRHLFNL